MSVHDLHPIFYNIEKNLFAVSWIAKKEGEEERERGNEYNDIRNDQEVKSVPSMRSASIKKQT